MKKIKVLHFIHGMSTGGAEVLVKDYLKYINKKEFEVLLLCLRHFNESPYEEMMKKMGIKVVYIEDYLWLKSNNIIVKILNYMMGHVIARRVIRKEKPDIIHSHLCVNSYIKFARPSKNTFIIHTVHNEPKRLWPTSNSLRSFSRRRDFRSAKFLVKKYNMRFIVLHDEMRKEVDKLFSVSNSVVLNNGVDVSRFRSRKSNEKTRKKLGIQNDAYVVGHVGRFHKQKNHLFLIEVFKRIKEKNNRAFLIMIGEGREKSVIEKRLYEDGIDSYLILSNRDDMPEIFGVMDIFVFPSVYEGLSVALIEAQEAKIPCFISEGISRYAIISNQTKQLSLKMGPEKWAEKILDFRKPDNVIINDDMWDIQKITKKLEAIYIEGEKEKHGK